MKKVVRSISFRTKRGVLRLVAYASSSRGTRIVDGVVEIDVVGKDQKQINQAVAAGLKELLKNQPSESRSSADLPVGGV